MEWDCCVNVNEKLGSRSREQSVNIIDIDEKHQSHCDSALCDHLKEIVAWISHRAKLEKHREGKKEIIWRTFPVFKGNVSFMPLRQGLANSISAVPTLLPFQ